MKNNNLLAMRNIKALSCILSFLLIHSFIQAMVQACSGSSPDERKQDKNYIGRSLFNCTYGDYQCNDGGCYTNEQKCDGVPDCNDGSDEDNHHCGNALIQIIMTLLSNSLNLYFCLNAYKYRVLFCI